VNYCINPKCQNRQNSDAVKYCPACGTALLINDRYRILKPLRSLHLGHPTEIFEVEDWGTGEQEWGTHKVLKVLKYTNNSDLVRLFKQEARVLIWLRHTGIPKVEPDGYFRISLNSYSQYLQCLVMEKIPGENLDKYLEEQHKISQLIAIDWLKQLINILGLIHSQNIIHCDIKPSNIILKPNGELALVDFGSVKTEAGESLPIGSLGYAPPEQLAGKAIQQSDFFALGRTFVYLLTGKAPINLMSDNDLEQIIWRNSTVKIENSLADFIDEMMNIKPEKRPKSTGLLLKKLKVFVTPP
jgi:serine/threonine protein kinase